jgi:hypothetical protein
MLQNFMDFIEVSDLLVARLVDAMRVSVAADKGVDLRLHPEWRQVRRTTTPCSGRLAHVDRKYYLNRSQPPMFVQVSVTKTFTSEVTMSHG